MVPLHHVGSQQLVNSTDSCVQYVFCVFCTSPRICVLEWQPLIMLLGWQNWIHLDSFVQGRRHTLWRAQNKNSAAPTDRHSHHHPLVSLWCELNSLRWPVTCEGCFRFSYGCHAILEEATRNPKVKKISRPKERRHKVERS